MKFEVDSVVPSSSYTAAGLGIAFAIYGMATGKPHVDDASTLKAQIEEKKGELNGVESKIGDVEGQLAELKLQAASLRTSIGA